MEGELLVATAPVSSLAASIAAAAAIRLKKIKIENWI